MYNHLRQKERAASVLTGGSSRSSSPVDRVFTQMKILAGFYSFCSFFDWSIYYLGLMAISDGHLLCYRENVLLVNSNIGALYMFSLSLAYYLYALLMWWVFFMVPTRFGQVSQFNVEQLGIVARDSELVHQNEEEHLKVVVREFEHDRKFTKKQILQNRKLSETSQDSPILSKHQTYVNISSKLTLEDSPKHASGRLKPRSNTHRQKALAEGQLSGALIASSEHLGSPNYEHEFNSVHSESYIKTET